MWVLYIRFFSLLLLALYLIVTHKKNKKNKTMSQQDETFEYKKNKDGRYPWEVDIDDSPNRITKETPKFIEKDRIRRGHWRK